MRKSYIKNYFSIYPNKVDKFTNEQQKEYFDNIFNYIPSRDLVNYNQNELLKDIRKAFLYFDNLLKPLEEFGLIYDLGIVGGSLRDLICDKSTQVNDLDIVINLRKDTNFKNHIINSDINYYYDYIYKLIQEESNASIALTDKEKYTFNSISYLIKIENEILNKKVDLIFISTDIPLFCSTFDFEICKFFIVYKKNSVQLINLEESNSHLNMLEHLMLHQGCAKDLENKTLSIRKGYFKNKEIDYFMNKHYLKLKEKYSNYKLNFFKHPYSIDISNDISSFYLNYELLDEKLTLEFSIKKENFKNNEIKKNKV